MQIPYCIVFQCTVVISIYINGRMINLSYQLIIIDLNDIILDI